MFIVNALVVVTFGLFGDHDIYGRRSSSSAPPRSSAGGAAVATVGSFAVLGSLFGILTAFQLLELANPSQPLLRRLLVETPGTYHHSPDGREPRRARRRGDRRGPAARARRGVLPRHRQALEPGRVHREPGGRREHPRRARPGDVRAAAQEPRQRRASTSPTSRGCRRRSSRSSRSTTGPRSCRYFYARAKEQAAAPFGGLETAEGAKAAEAVDIRKFRHGGPKPQVREAAIIMLADSVEASVRSLSSRDEAAIRAMVSRIIEERIADDQFDECDLTLRDIEMIREAFVGAAAGDVPPARRLPAEQGRRSSRASRRRITAYRVHVTSTDHHKNMVHVPAARSGWAPRTSIPEERPVHPSSVDGFWIDEHQVTVAEFRRFVKATGYVTLAERPLDPADYPDADPALLVPGSLVFHATPGPVRLTTTANGGATCPGASWQHPEGPARHVRARPPPGHAGRLRGRRGVRGMGGQGAADRGRVGVRGARRPRRRGVRLGRRGSRPAGGMRRTSGRASSRGRTRSTTASPARRRCSVPAQRLRAVRHDRQRLGVDGRLLRAAIPTRSTIRAARRTTRASTPGRRAGDRAPIPRRVTKGGSHLCAPNYCLRYRPAARQGEAVDTSHEPHRLPLHRPVGASTSARGASTSSWRDGFPAAPVHGGGPDRRGRARCRGAPRPASIGLILADDAELAELTRPTWARTARPTCSRSRCCHVGLPSHPASRRRPVDNGGVAFALPPDARPHLGDVICRWSVPPSRPRPSPRGGQTGDVAGTLRTSSGCSPPMARSTSAAGITPSPPRSRPCGRSSGQPPRGDVAPPSAGVRWAARAFVAVAGLSFALAARSYPGRVPDAPQILAGAGPVHPAAGSRRADARSGTAPTSRRRTLLRAKHMREHDYAKDTPDIDFLPDHRLVAGRDRRPAEFR